MNCWLPPARTKRLVVAAPSHAPLFTVAGTPAGLVAMVDVPDVVFVDWVSVGWVSPGGASSRSTSGSVGMLLLGAVTS